MRFKYNKQVEFFFKKYFVPETFLLKKRLNRSFKNKDEEEIKLVKNLIKKGTDAIDVGVYRGVYSFEMSKYAENVYAFEPNPIIFNYLNVNLTKIIKNIKLSNLALSNESKILDLKIPIRNKNFKKENYEEYYQLGKATVHEKNTFENFEKFQVMSKKIDELQFKNEISFIKIDVEGHEKEVVEGGLNTIKKFKPKLLIEIETKYTKKKVSDTINYINSIGYESFFYENNSLKKTLDIEDFNLYNNYIFFPKNN